MVHIMDSRLASFPEVLNVETSPMAKDQARAGQTNMGFSSKHCLVVELSESLRQAGL